MAHKKTRSKTEPNLGAIGKVVKQRDAQADRLSVLSPVEMMLLGGSPDDIFPVIAHPVDLVKDHRSVQIEVIREYLAGQPGLRVQLEKEVTEASRRAKGQRGEFLKALAERRAQVVSLAQIGQLSQQTPQAITDFHEELSRYLTDMEGFDV